MLNYKLYQIKILAKEIERLEGLRNQIEKSPNANYKKEYYENLKRCKNEFSRLSSEDLLENLELSDEEKRMVFLYFYKNVEWKDAMYKALSNKMCEKMCDDESGELETNTLNNLKKHIYNTIQVFYDYRKKRKN